MDSLNKIGYPFFVNIYLQKGKIQMRDFNFLRLMNENEGSSKRMSYTEVYRLISKPWINTEEIKKLCLCGNKKAAKIRSEVEEKVIAMGKTIPECARKIIPTPILLEYLNIDIDYVYEMAEKEQKLNSNGIEG